MISRPSPQDVANREIRTIRGLADQFRAATAMLQATPADKRGIAEIRLHMTTGGRSLLNLMNVEAIDVPAVAPPWLRWSMRRFGPRPTISRLEVKTALGSGPVFTAHAGLRSIARRVMSLSSSLDEARPERPLESEPIAFRLRHVFLEAAIGWLGQRLGLRNRIRPPFAEVDAKGADGERRITAVLDWGDASSDNLILLFLDLGRAGEAVCRRIGEVIRPRARTSPLATAPDPQPPASAGSPKASLPGRDHGAEAAYVHVIAERWTRAAWFATGGGLPGTDAGSRSILSDMTDRLLRHARKTGHPCGALHELGGVLAEILASEIWSDGAPWKTRAMCRVCGALKFETSGRCSSEPGGCDGEIEVLGEDDWVTEARFHRGRLMARLAEVLVRAKTEVQQMRGPVVETDETAPEPDTPDSAVDNEPPGDAPGAMAKSELLEFTAVERAITLLMRDSQRKSVREYAKQVDVHHSTLLRNKQWQKAWAASEPAPSEFPMGTKDADGNLEAWQEEVCEHCRQERITQTATVEGEVVRICEGCSRKLVQRTNPRTT